MSLHALVNPYTIGLSALFAVACALLLLGARGRLERRLITWVLAAGVVDLIGGVTNLMSVDNALMYNLYWPLEFVLLMRLAALWPQGRIARSPWLYVAFLFIWAVEMALQGGRPQFVIHSFLCGTMAIVAVYLLLLWTVVNEHRGPLQQHAPFWLCLAVLLYFGASAPILGSVNYFSRVDLPLARDLFLGVRILCIVKFILMGLTCLRARPPALATA